MAKDRGIDIIEKYSGDFLKIIERTIKKKDKVKILEAGCGYGMAMMGFVKRFGNKVEMVGFNSSKNHGGTGRMKREAIEKGIFTPNEIKKVKNLPKFVYCDADKKLPFKSNTFDFIYSKSTIYLIADKIHFLEECNRVLKKGGIARLQPGWTGKVKTNPKQYWGAWEVWHNGKEIPIYNYLKKIKGVKVGIVKGQPSYLEVKKTPKSNYKLKFISSIDTNFIWHKYMGVKSIYTTQLKFKPHWKVK